MSFHNFNGVLSMWEHNRLAGFQILSRHLTMETPIDCGKGAGEGERESVGNIEGEQEKFCCPT